MTDVFKAAMEGDLNLLKAVKNADCLFAKDKNGSTLMFYGVMSDDPEVLAFLSECGLSVTETRNDGESPLHIACIRDKRNAATWLVEHGAVLDARDRWSRRPVDCVATGNHELIKIVQPLQMPPIRQFDRTGFETALKDRLRTRWSCDVPNGLSDNELALLESSLKFQLPWPLVAYLKVCGNQNGNMFYAYDFGPTRWSAMQSDFAAFCKAYKIEASNVFTFLSYLREEFWAFEPGPGKDDPFVLNITVDGVRPSGQRLSRFIVEWEQFEEPV